jgi:hypothetical protein
MNWWAVRHAMQRKGYGYQFFMARNRSHGTRFAFQWTGLAAKGDCMISFSRYAFIAMMRDACLVMLAACLLMVAFGDELWLSVDVAATVALVFSVVLVIRAVYLTEERFLRSEAWVALRVEERPRDQALARARLQVLLLRFAKNAAGIAGLLYGSALLLSLS